MADNVENTAEVAAENASKYTLEELKEAAKQVFGVNSEVIDGATHGMEDRLYTVEEVRKLIDEFLNKKVGE